MTTYRFQEVRHAERRSGRCACGKKATMSRTFTQTINPFNKNAVGAVKDAQEIRAELRAEAAAWKPDFTCAACSTAARADEVSP